MRAGLVCASLRITVGSHLPVRNGLNATNFLNTKKEYFSLFMRIEFLIYKMGVCVWRVQLSLRCWIASPSTLGSSSETFWELQSSKIYKSTISRLLFYGFVSLRDIFNFIILSPVNSCFNHPLHWGYVCAGNACQKPHLYHVCLHSERLKSKHPQGCSLNV